MSTDLFEPGPEASPESTVAKGEPDSNKSDSSEIPHLPETRDGIKRVPEMLRESLTDLCDATYIERLKQAQARKDGYSASMKSHSAKLAALSVAGYAGLLPWHSLVTPAEVRRADQILRSRKALAGVVEYLSSLEPANVFVQANENEQRTAYLLRVFEVLRGRRFSHLLLDATVMDPTDDSGRLEVSGRLGILGCHVSIVEPEDAPKHSMMAKNPLIIAAEKPVVPLAITPAPASITNRLQTLRARKEPTPASPQAAAQPPTDVRRPRSSPR